MAAKARLVTSIDGPVDRRLRMFALLKGRRVCDALNSLLDQALPPVEELAVDLRETEVAS